MTRELFERWQAGQPPFDGLTLAPAGEDHLPLSGLRAALLHLVAELRREYAGTPLFAADDWHEHDGFLSLARPVTWAEIEGWLASDAALYAARHQDTHVRRALMPNGLGFYLRFHVPDDSERDYPERRGIFDLTCPAQEARRLGVELAEVTGLTVALIPPGEFFASGYGG